MINSSSEDKRYSMDDLLSIMAGLRRDCPWDREQTHHSIRMNFIEETYEACEAIDNGDDALLCEELGDVLLQVVFHSRMAEERGAFSFEDVLGGICNKLISRHPHIYSGSPAGTADEVLKNWESIKLDEKGGHAAALQGVAKSLPSLMRAEKLASRAKKAGVPTDTSAVSELCENGDIGKLLFAIAAYAKERGTNPEQALAEYCDAFVEEFQQQ